MRDRQPDSLELTLARLLQVGTIVACVIIAFGVVLEMLGRSAQITISGNNTALDLVSIGIATFILLPVARVIVMLVSYLRTRDFGIAVMAGIVLVLMALGLLAGIAFRG